MPAVSERQRRFFGADLARKRAGEKTQTGMSEAQLRDFASKRKKLLPKLRKFGLKQGVFEHCGIDPNARAENLSLEAWQCLLMEARPPLVR